MLLFIFILIFFCDYIRGELTEVIQTHRGPVQGEILPTAQNSSIIYSSFRGIPFAKPPIGELRFQPPEEVDAWSETLTLTSEATRCMQIINDSLIGSEDCLYLNVYTPMISFENSNDLLKAVMVWIYGGGFVNGEITTSLYGPDFFIAEDVVVVAMNYRIGALGFLSLNAFGATGNNGLKDQNLALKWVQKNIKNFGGDPNKVTLIGQSAGSACALLHQISPSSKGLFRGVIAMSGSPLNPWALASIAEAEAQAYNLVHLLNISLTLTKEQILERLNSISAEKIVYATDYEIQTELLYPPFMPTYEDPKIAKDAFLMECTQKSFQTGRFINNVPVMLGFTNLESVSWAGSVINLVHMGKYTSNIAKKMGPINSTFIDTIFDIFKTSNSTSLDQLDLDAIEEAITLSSDLLLVIGIDSFQKYLAKYSSPVWYYRNSFDYNESMHRLAGVNLPGTGHSDDIAEIFWRPNTNQSLDPNSRIGVQRKKMVRLWSNFVKYLNPTPHGKADNLLNVNWVPSGPEGLHLEIGQKTMEMEPRPADAIVKIVQSVTKPYENELICDEVL